MSVENGEPSHKEKEDSKKEGQEEPTPDLKEIAQEVRKSLIRDTSVVLIPKGEKILMTDKS